MSATLLDVPMQTTALPAIQLADLVAEADLQTRVDRKYLLPFGDVQAYVDALPAGTRVLEIDGRPAAVGFKEPDWAALFSR